MKQAILFSTIMALAAPTLAQDSHAPARDTYHGVTVTDPYRWLEQGDDPQVKAWVAAQNARSRAYLDALPVRSAIAAELKRIEEASSVADTGIVEAGGRLFALTYFPGQQQPQLSMLALSGDPATRRPVLDPAKISADGSIAIDWFKPSPDGRVIAVSLSRNGSEDGTLHLYEVDSGRELEPPIPHVQFPTGGGSAAWTSDGKGFWYTRYPGDAASEADRHFNQQAYFHRLGSDAGRDPLVLATKDGLPRTAEIFLSNPGGAAGALASVQLGDGGEWQHFVLSPTGARLAIPYAAKVKAATLDRDGTIYAISVKDAPNGKLLRFAPGQSTPTTLLPEGKIALVTDPVDEAIVVSGDRLYLSAIDGGPTVIMSLGKDGRGLRTLDVPPVSSASQMVAMPGGDLLYRVRSYTHPSRVLLWKPALGRSIETPITLTSPLDMSDFAVERVFATSKDGTKVPMTLVTKKGAKRDGRIPTLLYGYGGYGVNLSPGFLNLMAYMIVKAGGAYAIANIRGGGEYGERWHQQGMLTRKQNVFDDFAAAAEWLKSNKVTSTDKLAIMGGSNGGLLMGATMTQHPDIAKAVVSEVGIYDMLRVELDPNGSFNVSEFGSVKDPAQFKALYAYSPLHHVRAGVQYPAVFLATGDNDGRVNPMHSRKFAAALQASGSGAPVYLRTSAKAGHGHGSSLDESIALEADVAAFLFDQLGLRWPPAE
jgi:prolyl oligopeptidase